MIGLSLEICLSFVEQLLTQDLPKSLDKSRALERSLWNQKISEEETV